VSYAIAILDPADMDQMGRALPQAVQRDTADIADDNIIATVPTPRLLSESLAATNKRRQRARRNGLESADDDSINTDDTQVRPLRNSSNNVQDMLRNQLEVGGKNNVMLAMVNPNSGFDIATQMRAASALHRYVFGDDNNNEITAPMINTGRPPFHPRVERRSINIETPIEDDEDYRNTTQRRGYFNTTDSGTSADDDSWIDDPNYTSANVVINRTRNNNNTSDNEYTTNNSDYHNDDA